jgi:monoamine oxidase
MEEYDYLIVGAGLAGLHSALRLARMYPKARIAIAEAYNYNGGRVVSYHSKQHNVHVENGAGRVHNSHVMTLGYIDKYKLKTFPISPDQNWIDSDKKEKESTKNIWPTLSFMLHTLLGSLRPAELSSHTIYELLHKIVGEQAAMRILNRFPYRAEMFVMRADIALESIANEMGTNDDFFVVKEGLSAMIDGMVSELESMDVETNLVKRDSSTNSSGFASSARRIEFFYNHRCFKVEDRKAWFVIDSKPKQTCITAKKIILALHNSAMKKISPFAHMPLLKKVIMCPLLRIYAKFPVKDGVSWFSGLHHTVTNSPLRYIIPINPKEGVIMISYTDAQDTLIWSKILNEKGEIPLKNAIMKEVRILFPDKHIPEPTFFKPFLWDVGCSYWAPGMYSPQELSRKAHHPLPELLPNVYMCGESYSMKQCWMEGALEHADELIQRYFSNS